MATGMDASSSSSGGNLGDCVDDSYYSALLAVADEDLGHSDEEEEPRLHPVEEMPEEFDKSYAKLIQFQEVLVSSAEAAMSPARLPDSGRLPGRSSGHFLTATSGPPVIAFVEGESSRRRTFCGICFEARAPEEMFPLPNCGHVFCKDCVCRHIAVNLREKITGVKCLAADCGAKLEPDQCREVIPVDVLDRWGTALCESMLLGCQTCYCPFKDCSAPMLEDEEEEVRATECPYCNRLFCARCAVPWHAGVDCEDFQKLGPDERGSHDLMLADLARNKNWKRCPSCKFYVERREGCLHMRCRCGSEFCYGCGSVWSNAHTACHT